MGSGSARGRLATARAEGCQAAASMAGAPRLARTAARLRSRASRASSHPSLGPSNRSAHPYRLSDADPRSDPSRSFPGQRLGPLVCFWSGPAVARYRGRQEFRLNTRPTTSVGMDRFSRVGEIGTRDPLTPDIGSVSTNVLRRPIFLRDKDFAHRCISVDKVNGGQNGGQTHS
jgi:hypothetical protein